MQLRIDPVVESAEEIVRRVREELSEHQGLDSAAQGVARAAREAQQVSRKLRRPWGLHRLPAMFLAVALIVFGVWIYWRFLRVETLTIALPERDAIQLHTRVLETGRVIIQEKPTLGSSESLELLSNEEVDLAFIQGGVKIPPGLPRLQIPQSETLLFFLREGIAGPQEIRLMMTSSENQGSHTVAQQFAEIWRIDRQVEYLHDWREMTADSEYKVPANVDAVFVIKDLANDQTYAGVRKLHDAGFRLASPNIGAKVLTLDYLTPAEIPTGYLETNPLLPRETISTYSVSTFLVARKTLTPRLFAEAIHLLDKNTNTLKQLSFEPTFSQAKEVFEAIESFLGILVYLGLASLTLLGIEISTYRRRFNELNTFISLISMHQSDKDVLGLTDDRLRAKNLLYLGLCSDLLGIIGVITGYYSQENPSLLYNRLTEIIYQRSSSLKLNIQLKILHATIEL
ncbi:MAG: hypothetical protein KDA84_14925, partial [Planctomycetaceae bacterium]|nr:hypothetical protein [Planctomycetaceae bacterium]